MRRDRRDEVEGEEGERPEGGGLKWCEEGLERGGCKMEGREGTGRRIEGEKGEGLKSGRVEGKGVGGDKCKEGGEMSWGGGGRGEGE